MNTIALKIDGEPWSELQSANAMRGLAIAIAFCHLLDFRVRADLGKNLVPRLPVKPQAVALRTGFLATFDVFDLDAGLLTVQKVIEQLHLAKHREIASMSETAPVWHHHSGPDFGPFELHFDDLHEIVKTVSAVLTTPFV
jgi:hypothetical protein